MSTAIITPQSLQSGSFYTPGYKHACNVIICASLALKQKVRIPNAPNISDTQYLCRILIELGANVVRTDRELVISNGNMNKWAVPPNLSEHTHGAIYFLPALLGRYGKVTLGRTGGCQIGAKSKGGARPIHHMIDVLSKFGAHFSESGDSIIGTSDGFSACEIDISIYSDQKEVVTGPLISGATKTAIIAALFVNEGTTIIRNPYKKPDVTELLQFASNAGYEASFSSDEIRISKLREPNDIVTHLLVDDISAVMTYITLSVYHGVNIKVYLNSVERVKLGLKPELALLDQMGVRLNWKMNALEIPLNESIQAVDIAVTSMSIYSDHQPFFALLLTKSEKQSRIKEFVWGNRFTYATELNKLSVKNLFKVSNNEMDIIPGKLEVGGQTLFATDLRAAAILLLSSLSLNGITNIENIEHLNRGYEHLLDDFRSIGAEISVLT